MVRQTMVTLGVAVFAIQMVTGCGTTPDTHRFVLEDGTVILADTGADGPSKEATEKFKRLYAAFGRDDDVDNPQAHLLSLAKMLNEVDLGDPAVQEVLGDMHCLGCGVKRDVAKAFCWYKKAAEKNRPEAQSWIGQAYWCGLHVPCDQAEAVKWFRKASENGSADAPRLLGTAYADGLGGLSVDKKLAFQYFLMSAERGNAQAQFAVGKAYEEGDGVARNAVDAVKWYEKSSRGGFVNASEALARIYEEGRDGVPKDSDKAVHWRRNFNERVVR